MSRWFRHYGGMMRDEKLVSVAVKSKQPVERVVWVWGAILESAAEIDDGGKYDFDESEAAYFLRADEADILAIINALDSAGRISENIVVKWGDRQYQSDKSVARQSAYRERRRAEKGIGDSNHIDSDGHSATSDDDTPSRDSEVTLQETDTEEDTEKKERKNPLTPKPDLDEAMKAWNLMASEKQFPQIQRLTDPRKRSLSARLVECGGLGGWQIALTKVRDSPFLNGDNDRGWRADFDFLLQQKSFTKLMEGAYDGQARNPSKSNSIQHSVEVVSGAIEAQLAATLEAEGRERSRQ